MVGGLETVVAVGLAPLPTLPTMKKQIFSKEVA